MKHKGTDSFGSFKAWGVGLNYEYDGRLQTLDVFDAQSKKPLIYINFDSALSDDAFRFVKVLEKTTQINALMLSNNGTINLSETIDGEKLSALLASSASLARYGFDLESEDFDRFSQYFCEDFALKTLQIRRVVGNDPQASFFVALLETQRNNAVSARAASIHGLLLSLSDHIIRDVITIEFGYNYQSSAHMLLRMTSKLSALSFILNDHFLPANKLNSVKSEAATEAKA